MKSLEIELDKITKSFQNQETILRITIKLYEEAVKQLLPSQQDPDKAPGTHAVLKSNARMTAVSMITIMSLSDKKFELNSDSIESFVSDLREQAGINQTKRPCSYNSDCTDPNCG